MSEQIAKDARSQCLPKSDAALLASWNKTSKAYPEDLFVPELVSAQAAANTHAIAVTKGGGTLTYGDLDSRANRLANHLISLGAGRDTLVALCVERSLELVVSALGVLKAGAAYVPLDPRCPTERLNFMLNDSRAPVIVTQRSMAPRLPNGGWRVLEVDGNGEQIGDSPASRPNIDLKTTDLAYVIYTSGSTGRPKGVQITHGNLLNLVFWHQCTFEINPADRATLMASPGFDASVWELWPYITAGASVHIPEEATRNDARRLRDWLVTQRITITFVPTPLAELVIGLEWPSPIALRAMLTGAETLHRCPSPSLPFVLVNNYGPTECTVVATSGIIPSSEHAKERPTIGRPIANTQIYILAEHLRQVKAGVTGELYIGGKGLGRGYLNQPQLTDERFIPNPFSSEPGARLYKTGDLGRYLPDGQITFMGRIDDQIKIRGYRVEPNEIVTVLNRHSSILASHVIAQESGEADKRLVAYLVLSPGSPPAYGELLDYLRTHLPAYMVPSIFVILDSLPLTFNGKVDRQALPTPNRANTLQSEPQVPARTLVEKRLATILGKLLRLQKVGASDNFFLLGGHSLLGTQLIISVRESFGVELSLRSLFEAPTVAELSVEIERLLVAKLEAISEEDAKSMLGALAS
jgi:amino acid adenylation domain-containing protein